MTYVITHHFLKEGISPGMMGPHVIYLKDLFDKGKLVITGHFIDEARGGLFILDVENETELKGIVDNDPAVVSGLVSRPIQSA